jgi:hypothetical protein
VLTEEQLADFGRDGFVRVPGAFTRDEAGAMEGLVWRHLETRDMRRDDPTTWHTGSIHHLQGLRGDPVFAPILGPTTCEAIDDVLGAGRWKRPGNAGQFLVTFPSPRATWHVPTGIWHSDASYLDPLTPPAGVWVFSFLNRVGPGAGGTLIIGGSPAIIARWAATRPTIGAEKSKTTRLAFYRSHPWLADLVTAGDEPARTDRLLAPTDVDGLPVRVVELTGEPGDIVLAHPLIAHCVAPACGAQPRMMRIARPRVVDNLAAPAQYDKHLLV